MRAVLASAYEVELWQVENDALTVEDWRRGDDELMRLLDERHRWTSDSEYSTYYLAALREAIVLADNVD